MSFWLIYAHKNRLEPSYQAMNFDSIEEMHEWLNERKDECKFIAVAKSVEDDED